MSERKVAVVTAAAGAGIGGAVARRLADDGYQVVVTDKHAQRSEKFAIVLSETYGREFTSWALDVADPDSVETVFAEIVDRHSRIDLLVNNAGFSVSKPIVELSVDDWKTCVDIDLNGTFYCMRAALRHMIERRTGNIVNLSSTAAWEAIPDHGAPYSAAKSGVLALTRVAASEVGRHGIRVNAVAPGLIYNEFLKKIYPDDFFEGFADRRTFLGRLGAPDDVANVIAFLASDQAAYVTGEVYGVSGGTAPHA
ncbi:SDR family NAD(P)-dependent oxidoreductase [Rhodococcus opacus]|uniref:SDR family NAD(P)-dependent oxidoreductase n=1 Tax=Rhodococcus opacus TaxID=37919 RepID=UPI0024BB8685|nr:SDR family oxidoreductase [Rhodococcus opacus]MDJ0419875.1 SDR family oxidoreductase [Rhodococcus opacus]MDV6245266.1 SDR family oxidoreductase [Rhodococcus opacus]